MTKMGFDSPEGIMVDIKKIRLPPPVKIWQACRFEVIQPIGAMSRPDG